MSITKRQRKLLEYIDDVIKELGYPPTIREMGRYMRISSTNGISCHLNSLERKGLIQKDINKARALRITELGAVVIKGPIPEHSWPEERKAEWLNFIEKIQRIS